MRGALACALLVAQPGCVMKSEELSLRVVDPAAVSLSSGWVSDAGQAEVLPAGKASPPRSARLAEGRIPTGTVSSASYELYADRGADGSIALRWARPHIINGDRYMVAAPGGEVTVTGLDARRLLRDATPESLRIPLSAWLSEDFGEYGLRGYDGDLGYPADDGKWRMGALDIRFTLETPWSNVGALTRRVRPKRRAAVILALLATATLGAAGVTMLAAPDVSKPVRAAGGALAGAGGTIDLLLLPTMVAGDVDEPVRR